MTTKQDIVLDQIATLLNKLQTVGVIQSEQKTDLFNHFEREVQVYVPNEEATLEQKQWNINN